MLVFYYLFGLYFVFIIPLVFMFYLLFNKDKITKKKNSNILFDFVIYFDNSCFNINSNYLLTLQ